MDYNADYKLNFIKKLNYNFDKNQLHYIYDTQWFYINSDFKEKELIFKENSFSYQKDFKNYKLILKFDKNDFHIFISYILHIFEKYSTFKLVLNNEFKYETNWDENWDLCCHPIDMACEKNLFFFKNIQRYVKLNDNELVFELDEESKEILINLISIKFSKSIYKNPNIDQKNYIWHIIKKNVF